MFIVEGPDGAGKSTLVQHLVKRYHFTVGERATNDRDLLFKVTKQDTYTALAEAVRGDKYPKVWDRLFYSEWVYHHITSRECAFTPLDQHTVDAVLTSVGIPVILCLPPFDVVQANVHDEGHQMEGVKKHIAWIYGGYQALIGETHGRDTDTDIMPSLLVDYPALFRYDYTKGPDHLAELERFVERYLSMRMQREWVPVSEDYRG